MKFSRQTTLRSQATVTGVGVHSGLPVNLTLGPASIDAGFIFVRTGLDGCDREVQATAQSVTATAFATVLGDRHGPLVSTAEHVLAALRGNAGADHQLAEPGGVRLGIGQHQKLGRLGFEQAVLGTLSQAEPEKPDFRRFSYAGRIWNFTEMQARGMLFLFEAAKSGDPEQHFRKILDAAHSGSDKIAHLYSSRRDWTKVILKAKGRLGWYFMEPSLVVAMSR